MANTQFGKTLIDMTEGAINGIGKIGIPVNVDSAELSFSISPKVDLNAIDLENFNISQIDISDTEIGISFNKQLDDNFKVNFNIDSKLSDFTKSISENGTRFSFNIAGTQINQKIDLSLGASGSLCSLVSPSGTNDFQMNFSMKAKL